MSIDDLLAPTTVDNCFANLLTTLYCKPEEDVVSMINNRVIPKHLKTMSSFMTTCARTVPNMKGKIMQRRSSIAMLVSQPDA